MITHTMMYERIDPLTPIKDPTLVSKGLSSIRPTSPQFNDAFIGMYVMQFTFSNQSKSTVG